MRHVRNNLTAIGVTILLGVCISFLYQDLWREGVPDTHDGQNHLARMTSTYLAVRTGQIPARWGAFLNDGFGYPALHYNYPLANYLSLAPLAFNVPVEVSYTLQVFAALMLAAMGMYVLARKYVPHFQALLIAIVSIVQPYTLTLVYVRGVIGELWAMALIPLVILVISRCLEKGLASRLDWLFSLAVLVAFLLSHNIMVYLLSPLLVGYAILLFWKKKRPWKKAMSLWWLSLMALLTVSFFWIPALAERDLVRLDQSPLSKEYYRHFTHIDQLWLTPFNWGYSRIGPVDSIPLSLGMFGVAVLLIGIPMVIVRKSVGLAVLLGTLLASLLLQTEYSSPLWPLIPHLPIIQFPWRLLLVSTLLASMAGIWLLYLDRRLTGLFLLLIIWQGILAWKAEPKGYVHQDDSYWYQYAQTTTIMNENMPIAFEIDRVLSESAEWFDSGPVYLEGEGTVKDLNWRFGKHSYTVEVMAPTLIVERTAWFPHWVIKANGEVIEADENFIQQYGLLAFRLEKGMYQVTTHFSQKTFPTQLGNSLSMLGVITIMGTIWNVRRASN